MSIGETLAEARRQAGLTTTQVGQRTRIRESIIRGIEQGDFSACGGDFYARGHIRSIAGVVGLDPAPLIHEYDTEHGPPGSISAAEVFEPSTPIKIRERRSPSLTMIVIVVLLGIIGYSAYHLVSTHGKHGKQSSARPQATRQAAPSAQPTASAVAAPRPSDVVIQVNAFQDCWVLLTSSRGGSKIYMGVVPAGSSMRWTEKRAVHLELGNPGGVMLTVDGKQRTPKTTMPVTLNLSPAQT